jgi:hypothetical protein
LKVLFFFTQSSISGTYNKSVTGGSKLHFMISNLTDTVNVGLI